MKPENAGPAGKVCPSCGGSLTAQTWCARCALAGLLADEAEAGGAPAGLFTVTGHVVVAELGRGATGIVYRARQAEPAREVALKILRPHETGSLESRARFRLEATTVAGLDHPAILPVLSVGEHDGLPYFTMKLCAGGSLAHRLERYRGAGRASAALVAMLADAIQHAHQRGVLHRDLKPGNILFDEADRPFVSDFGLARSVRETDTGSRLTQPLAVMGTRGYLAPEVLRAGAGAATLLADVYGLGAILHELLVGTPPVENPTAVIPALRNVPRDLAVIVQKSLQLEPAARYGSAAALADDLRAWLEGRPIAARPLSPAGWAWAWARRNPALASVSAAGLLALVAIAAVATGAAVRLGREQRATAAALERAETARQRALIESATSKAIADFLQNDLLGQAAPDLQPERELKLRTVLDRAARTVGQRFADRPLVEASIRETLANTYGSLGDYAAMQVHLEHAVETRTRVEGAEAPKTLALSTNLAFALFKQGKLAAAETVGRRAFEAQQRTLGTEHPDGLKSMSVLSQIDDSLGQTEAALQLTERMLAISRRVLGADHVTTLTAMNDLAYLLGKQRRLAEAEALFQETLALRRRAQGAEHPATLVTMSNLAGLVRRQGHNREAEALYLELIGIEQRVLGPDHPYVLTAQGSLALTYQAMGKRPEAEALLRQVVEKRMRVFGPENATTLNSMTNLAGVLVDEGNYAEAETIDRHLLQAQQRTAGSDDPLTLTAAANLALVCRLNGKLAEAEVLEEQTLAARRRVLGPEHRDTLVSQGSLGLVYQARNKFADAEKMFAQRLEISRRVFGPQNPDTARALDRLGGLLLAEKRFLEAEPLLREAWQSRHEQNAEAWLMAAARSRLGAALTGLGKFSEAEPLLLEGYAALSDPATKIPGASHVDRREAGERLVAFYAVRGLPAEAEAWQQKIDAAEKKTPQSGPH